MEYKVVSLTKNGSFKKFDWVIILDKIDEKNYKVAMAKATEPAKAGSVSTFTCHEVWPEWNPNLDKTRVYDVEFMYGPLVVPREVCGRWLAMGLVKGKFMDSFIKYIIAQPQPNTISDAENQPEMNDFDDVDDLSDNDSPRKRPKLNREVVDAAAVQAILCQHLDAMNRGDFSAAVEALQAHTSNVQAEKIVRDKMRPTKDGNPNQHEYPLRDGPSEVRHYVDNVNLTTGWFEEFKKLEAHNALTALGQVIVYGEKLELRTGQRLKCRIVFFAQGDRNDAKQTFEKIIDDYKNQGVHLDEVVLVHADLDVENHDAKLVQLGCTDLKGDIDWTEEEEVGV
jgi:hypothetical protein